MGLPARQAGFTAENYLAWEQEQADRHEYLDGEVFAMASAEDRLIVEVLSPSTAAYDRGVKFSHYRSLASLQEYVLIDLDTRCTDCYRKGADGLWVLHPFTRGETVELSLSAEQLFAEVQTL